MSKHILAWNDVVTKRVFLMIGHPKVPVKVLFSSVIYVRECLSHLRIVLCATLDHALYILTMDLRRKCRGMTWAHVRSA
jgi:hypothetical protein